MYDRIKKNKLLMMGCLSVLILGGCATTGAGVSQISEIDPFEEFNRDVFVFNKQLDNYVTAPIVSAYTWVTPHFVQMGIGNFFSNLKDINVALNDIMQAKFEQGGADTGRFLLNTTVGLGGLFDVATDIGLEKHEEDFDQTFAVWGIPQGPYLVLPILGPTTGRGIGGTVLDTATNPATYVGYPIQVLSLVHERSNAEGVLKMVDDALDPYIFLREAFLQRRNYLIQDGKSDLAEDILKIEDVTLETKSSIPQIDKVNSQMDLGNEKKAVSQTKFSQSAAKK